MTDTAMSIEEMMKKLSAPLPLDGIEWRIQRSGLSNGKPWAMCLAYMHSRSVQNRLDHVFGIDGWMDEYREWMGKSVVCKLSCRMPNGEWVTKEDGAENTDIEAIKGGISDALKRAAVKFGIGRYLYKLPTGWANFHDNGVYSARIDGKVYKWDPPVMPDWALPEGEHDVREEAKVKRAPKKRAGKKKQAQEEESAVTLEESDGSLERRELISNIAHLQIALNQTAEEEDKMLKYYEVESVEDMSDDKLVHCSHALEKKLDKTNNK